MCGLCKLTECLASLTAYGAIQDGSLLLKAVQLLSSVVSCGSESHVFELLYMVYVVVSVTKSAFLKTVKCHFS